MPPLGLLGPLVAIERLLATGRPRRLLRFLGALRGLSGLDQLAHLLAALVADLLVELVPTGVADRLPALLPDVLVELGAAGVAHLLAALPAGLADGHSALLFVGHVTCLRPSCPA